MKQFKVYKVNAKATAWGLELRYFTIFFSEIVVSGILLGVSPSWTKLLVFSSVIVATYLGFKLMTERSFIDGLTKDKLPKRIRNAL